MRASERPDAESLRERLRIYHAYHQLPEREQEVFMGAHFEALDIFYRSKEDPDTALALVVAATMFDDPAFLFSMAAGPLEDVLRDPDPQILDRIVTEARKHPRFRWMLTGVFLHAIAERVRPAIEKAIGSMHDADPMPPRLA